MFDIRFNDGFDIGFMMGLIGLIKDSMMGLMCLI